MGSSNSNPPPKPMDAPNLNWPWVVPASQALWALPGAPALTAEMDAATYLQLVLAYCNYRLCQQNPPALAQRLQDIRMRAMFLQAQSSTHAYVASVGNVLSCCDSGWQWAKAAFRYVTDDTSADEALVAIITMGIEHSICGRVKPPGGDGPAAPGCGGSKGCCGCCNCACDGCGHEGEGGDDPCRPRNWPDALATGDARPARQFLDATVALALTYLSLERREPERRPLYEELVKHATLDRFNAAHGRLRAFVDPQGRGVRAGALGAAVGHVRACFELLRNPGHTTAELRRALEFAKHGAEGRRSDAEGRRPRKG